MNSQDSVQQLPLAPKKSIEEPHIEIEAEHILRDKPWASMNTVDSNSSICPVSWTQTLDEQFEVPVMSKKLSFEIPGGDLKKTTITKSTSNSNIRNIDEKSLSKTSNQQNQKQMVKTVSNLSSKSLNKSVVVLYESNV